MIISETPEAPEKIETIDELVAALMSYQQQYAQGAPVVSDETFDQLEEKLRALAPDHHYFNRVGAPSKGNIKKHLRPMLSLEKTYDLEKLLTFMGARPLVGLFKYDGLACVLRYQLQSITGDKDPSSKLLTYKLVGALTRGDGQQGVSIIEKIKQVPSVPHILSVPAEHLLYREQPAQLLEVRGELFCRTSSFFQLCADMEQRQLPKPTSLRNTVAGLMLRLDHGDLSKYLSLALFDIDIYTESDDALKTLYRCDHFFKSECEKFNLLSLLKLPAAEYRLCSGAKDVQELIDAAKDHSNNTGDFLIDGLVFSYDDIQYQCELGETSHHPRYKIAFKFQGTTKITEIKSIEWSISKSGVLTPVAIVEPVELSGASVARVTLHHVGYVEKFNLAPGVKIEIVRSGEVIPKFLRVIEEQGPAPLVAALPTHCPHCHSVLERSDLWLTCLNHQCPGRMLEQLLHVITSLGVEDLSEKRLQELMELGLVKSAGDLFKLGPEQLLQLSKTKDKLAQKWYEQLQRAKKMTLEQFVLALGLEGMGKQKIKKLLNHHGELKEGSEKIKITTVDQLFQITPHFFIGLEGFAERTIEVLLGELKKAYPLALELLAAGLVPTASVFSPQSQSLLGIKFCITGELSKPRDQWESELTALGAQLQNTVNKLTNYLVTNDQTGNSSKLKKARELKTKVITEHELKNLIK